ncbi:DegT/DnrJ/EryC1/StrS family aminotransferase [Novosphingobium sp. G106]|uniref:DegT/DnrJ/EryC1/StrS family aminotransferase n=1 Tax=Novosphingobium sp. G106 TaxID=2849500 RepID=UPI001C2DE13C|nr:DegT/DnrJ/EryC1/StrS family aminotransferase [Novosphingobium sp. G106]MBV1689344.1 DegT/DnrJ/EryC1/StrS family aminotransferase [Novosphingobium sp. G106]
MTYKVPLAFNTLGEGEIKAAMKVLASGFVTQGKLVEEFERQLADNLNARHAILVNSGSSANLIAIEAISYLSTLRPDFTYGSPMERGDEVIIQGLNWPSTITPIINRGLTPVFCDIDIHSLNATVAQVEAARTPRTRMIVAVPVLGNPSGLEDLRDYCSREKLILVEDSCESLGAVTERGNAVGTIGLASAFSFYFSHHLCTIEGGVILTDLPELADLCYALRSHGWTRHLKHNLFQLGADEATIDPRFCFVLPGYNVRSTEINAAIGRIQLIRLPEMLAARRRLMAGRIAAIADVSDRLSIPGATILDRHSWMTTPLLFSDHEHRQRGQAALELAGVETRPIIVGNILRHPLMRALGLRADQPDLPICDDVFARGLMIGLNPFSTPEIEEAVADALNLAAKA